MAAPAARSQQMYHATEPTMAEEADRTVAADMTAVAEVTEAVAEAVVVVEVVVAVPDLGQRQRRSRGSRATFAP